MEQPAKKRATEEAANLMDLPPETRLQVLYKLTEWQDVEAMCQVNKEFQEWCGDGDWLFKNWMKHNVRRPVWEEMAKEIRGDVRFHIFSRESQSYNRQRTVSVTSTGGVEVADEVPKRYSKIIQKWLANHTKIVTRWGGAFASRRISRDYRTEFYYLLFALGFALIDYTDWWNNQGGLKFIRCRVCSSLDNLQVCQGCDAAIYCSRACQTEDWRSGHKKACVRP